MQAKNTFDMVEFNFLHSSKTFGRLWNFISFIRTSLLLDGLFCLDLAPLEMTGALWPRLDFSPFKGSLSSRYKTCWQQKYLKYANYSSIKP